MGSSVLPKASPICGNDACDSPTPGRPCQSIKVGTAGQPLVSTQVPLLTGMMKCSDKGRGCCVLQRVTSTLSFQQSHPPPVVSWPTEAAQDSPELGCSGNCRTRLCGLVLSSRSQPTPQHSSQSTSHGLSSYTSPSLNPDSHLSKTSLPHGKNGGNQRVEWTG